MHYSLLNKIFDIIVHARFVFPSSHLNHIEKRRLPYPNDPRSVLIPIIVIGQTISNRIE